MRARLLALSASAVALAACGGGATQATPHFAASANAICAKTNSEIEALAPPSQSARSEAAVLRKGFAYARIEYDKLVRLTAPAKKETLFVTGLQAAHRLLTLGHGEIADFAKGDVAAASKLLDAGDRYSGETDASMSLLGLGACAADPQPVGKR